MNSEPGSPLTSLLMPDKDEMFGSWATFMAIFYIADMRLLFIADMRLSFIAETRLASPAAVGVGLGNERPPDI